MLLQKFPKEFLYCPRYLLKTVTKNTASEISETTFIAAERAKRVSSNIIRI